MNTQIKRKLHGSVLLTVVFVMSILIVFLFGTLALALAANNRAHVNYSSAQTSITARSVAESAVAALDKNVVGAKEYKAAVGALKSTSTPLSVKVGLSTPDTNENLGTMGHIDDVTISYAGKKKFFKDGKWEDRDLLKFTSNVTMSGVTSSASVYVLKQEKGDGEGEGSGGAGFITTAGAAFATQTDVMGGAYIGLPTLDAAQKIDYTTHETLLNTFKTADGTGNQINPISVAADGEASNAAALMNSNAVLEADFYVCDNLYVQNWSGVIFPDKSKGMTIWGDWVFNNNSVDHFKYTYHGSKDNLNFIDVPFIYVDGGIYCAEGKGKIKIGNNIDKFPLNTFCGWIESTQEDSVICSNLYCMDADTTSTLKGTAKGQNLYIWANSVITKTPAKNDGKTINGEVCTKGNLNLENCIINGDVRVEGDLTITQKDADASDKVIINGNVIVGGEIIGEEFLEVNGGEIYHATKGTATSEAIDLPNEKGTYEIKAIQQITVEEDDGTSSFKYADIDGNILNDGEVFIDGDLQEDNKYGIKNPLVDVTLYYTKDVDCPPIFSFDDDALCLTGEADRFYAKTSVTSFTDKDNYSVEVDYTQKVSESTFKFSPSAGPNVYLKNIGEKPDHIYPEYAEKKVILGLEKLKDKDDKEINASETQIVKTIDQILQDKKFTNPYDNKIDTVNGIMPAKILELSKSLESEAYITSADDMEYDAAEHALKITKSCKLDVTGIGANLSNGNTINKLIIDPGKEEIVIFVQNFSFNSARDTIIDDSQGGKVNIVIENGGTFGGTNNSIIYTRSYEKLMNDYSGQEIKYRSSASTPGKDIATVLGDKVKPNLYIYGGAGSKLDLQNMGFVTANIVSPELTVTIGGTEDGWNKASAFYYNDTNMNEAGKKRPLLIGCLNAGTVESKNIIDVLYATDGDDGGDAFKEDDDPFWYKILYYSEF